MNPYISAPKNLLYFSLFSPFVQCSSSPMEKQAHLCYTRFTGF